MTEFNRSKCLNILNKLITYLNMSIETIFIYIHTLYIYYAGQKKILIFSLSYRENDKKILEKFYLLILI